VRFAELQPRRNSSRESHSRAACRKRSVAGRKKLKTTKKARIEANIGAMDQGCRTEKNFRPIRGEKWRSFAAQSLAANDGAALRRVGLPVAIQSENDVKGDSPLMRWLTALLTIMEDPLNAYEIVGVLREFSRADHDLAVFSEGQRARFRITRFYRRPEEFPRSYVRSRKFANAQRLALFDAVT